MKDLKIILVLVLVIASSLTGCAQRKELRKARKQARYERRAEYFRVKAGLPECTDTIIADTIVTPKYIHDTTFKVSHDTTRYETERVTVEHHYDHNTERVYLKAECKQDTIKVERTVIKETKTVEVYPAWITSAVGVLKYWWVLLVVFALASGVIITLRVTKKIGL